MKINFKKIQYLFISSRPKHSIKNLLIFLPILASNNLYNEYLLDTFFAFFFLILITSATYILNDVIDFKYDSMHITKKFRPIASKKLSFSESVFFSFILIFFSIFCLIFLFNFEIVFYFILYLLITSTYSIFFKKIIWIDIFILSLLFLIRVYLGNLVSNLKESFWLLSFCFMFFLMLACVKRISELSIDIKSSGRGYGKHHIKYLKNLSYFLSCLASLVWVFYSLSYSADILYNFNELLIIVSFLILFWSLRIVKLSLNKNIGYDPVVFVIYDKFSYILFLIIFITILASKYLGI